MPLEDVIAQAISDAREDGLEGAQGGDEDGMLVEDPGADADEGTGDGDEGVVAAAEGTEGDEEKPAEGDGEKTEEEKLAEAAAALEAADAAAKDKKPEPKVTDKKTEFDLKKELGLKDRTDGRVHRIPLPRVEKIIANVREEASTAVSGVVAAVGKALGLPEAELATATVETLTPRLTEALADVGELREQVNVMNDIHPIMLNNGDKFIEMLAASNPAQYSKFLAVLQPDFVAPTAVTLPAEADDPKPEPDMPVTLADGSKGKTYSQAGYEKLLEWQDRKSQRVYKAELDKRFKPIEDKNKATATAEERQQALNTQLNDFMGEALQWKEFEGNKDAILTAVKAIDKKIPFRRAVRMAYEEVVFGKLHGDRVKMRAEILAELKKAPTTTSTTKKGAVSKKTGDDAPVRGEGGETVTGTEAAIRRSLAKARATGAIK